MTERAYTVSEIDALRTACQKKYRYGRFFRHEAFRSVSCFSSQARMEHQLEMSAETQAVEAMVRTYMLGGITSEDLYASEPELPTTEAMAS